MKNIKLKHLLLYSILLILILPATSHALEHESYAILFSGGVNANNNHIRYYQQTLRMWRIMTNTLGFDYDKVYVLFGDGLEGSIDQCVAVNNQNQCIQWTDSDWSEIVNNDGIIRPATYFNLDHTISEIAERITMNDSFHFWSFDHGYNETYAPDTYPTAPYGSTLDMGGMWAWGNFIPNDDPLNIGDYIPDDVFASWVRSIDAMAEDYIFAQCFAGDMADELGIHPSTHVFAAWAADYYEPSRGYGWADAWATGLESGLRSTWLLGQYALEKDPFGPLGKDLTIRNLEHPGWAGYNFNFITNEQVVPEPSTLLLLAAGLAGIGFVRWRMRKSNPSKLI
jgi:hypothetical protein